MKDKEDLIKRYFPVAVTHQKGGKFLYLCGG